MYNNQKINKSGDEFMCSNVQNRRNLLISKASATLTSITDDDVYKTEKPSTIYDIGSISGYFILFL